LIINNNYLNKGIRLGRIPKSMKPKLRFGEKDDDDDCIIIDGILSKYLKKKH
jgi:hypothetical protein